MRVVEHRFTVDLEADRGRVFEVVADLDGYDRWLDLVHRVEREPTPDDGAGGGDGAGPAWYVTLRARIGPLARSKRLRMVRTVDEEPTRVRFERSERDGRDHSPWTLEAELDAVSPSSTTLTMSLDYGGRLWTPALNPILDSQVASATEKLRRLVAATADLDD